MKLEVCFQDIKNFYLNLAFHYFTIDQSYVHEQISAHTGRLDEDPNFRSIRCPYDGPESLSHLQKIFISFNTNNLRINTHLEDQLLRRGRYFE